MLLQDAITKQRELAKNIGKLLQAFSDETGLTVSDVSFQYCKQLAIEPAIIYSSVNVEVKLS